MAARCAPPPTSFFNRRRNSSSSKKVPLKSQMDSVNECSPPSPKKRNSTTPTDPIEHILSDKWLCELFHEWAVANLCSENLLFYEEVSILQLVLCILHCTNSFSAGGEVQDYQ